MIEANEAAQAWTAVHDRIEELLGHKPDTDDVASYLHTIATFISERAEGPIARLDTTDPLTTDVIAQATTIPTSALRPENYGSVDSRSG